MLKFISMLLNFAAKILDIIDTKGDKADNMKLRDIPGWKKLKAQTKRHKLAMDEFVEKYRKRRS